MNRGFTLVELLVVVLIVGILTAIGLPQYQKAVSKALMAEAVSGIATLERAEQACVLANKRVNNTNCTSMDNLDVKLANSNNWAYGVNNSTSGCYFAGISYRVPQVCAYDPSASGSLSNSDVPWLSSAKYSSSGPWQRHCHYANAAQKSICDGLQQFGFSSTNYSSGYSGGYCSGYCGGYCSWYSGY